ncbi:MAG: response regulator transcription factor, partial [Tissierellia bacterium]|nr:response regulator transcription factor [Tissierellia bacterium]
MKEKVLIVDDHEDILDIISYYLKREGYEVLSATNSNDAIEILKDNQISAGVLDIMMPGMDGMDLCKLIRDKYFFPIMFLTAKSGESDKLEGFASGADDYMVKPFSSKELVARVKSMIRRSTKYNVKDIDEIRIKNL